LSLQNRKIFKLVVFYIYKLIQILIPITLQGGLNMTDSYQRRSGWNYVAVVVGTAALAVAATLGVTECQHKIKSLEDQIKHNNCGDSKKPRTGTQTTPKPTKQETSPIIININVTPCSTNGQSNNGNLEDTINNQANNNQNTISNKKTDRKRYPIINNNNEAYYDGELKVGDTFLYEDKLFRYDGGRSYGKPNFIIISAQGNMGNPYNRYYNMNFVSNFLFQGFVGNISSYAYMNYNMGRLNNINMMYNNGFMNIKRVGNSLHSTTMPNYNQRRVNTFRMFGF
jgi:hypothetical protein